MNEAIMDKMKPFIEFLEQCDKPPIVLNAIGAKSIVVLRLPGRLSIDAKGAARLRESCEGAFPDVGVVMLEDGMDLSVVSIPPQSAQPEPDDFDDCPSCGLRARMESRGGVAGPVNAQLSCGCTIYDSEWIERIIARLHAHDTRTTELHNGFVSLCPCWRCRETYG